MKACRLWFGSIRIDLITMYFLQCQLSLGLVNLWRGRRSASFVMTMRLIMRLSPVGICVRVLVVFSVSVSVLYVERQLNVFNIFDGQGGLLTPRRLQLRKGVRRAHFILGMMKPRCPLVGRMLSRL